MTKYRKTIGLSALATGAALIAPQLASANVAIACDTDPANVRIVTSGHPAGAPIVVTTFGNGAVIDRRTLADDGSFAVPAPEGVTVEAMTEQYGYQFRNGRFVKRCVTSVPPATPPGVTPPPPSNSPPTLTCADLVERGAGRRRLIDLGCVPARPPRPPELCARDAKLTITQPDRTLAQALGGPPFYVGTVEVRNTTGRAIRRGLLTVSTGPLQFFLRGERRPHRITFPVNMRAGGTMRVGYRFGHPAASLNKRVTVRAQLGVCGRTVAGDTDTLLEDAGAR